MAKVVSPVFEVNLCHVVNNKGDRQVLLKMLYK